jgi:hypothetical protein
MNFKTSNASVNSWIYNPIFSLSFIKYIVLVMINPNAALQLKEFYVVAAEKFVPYFFESLNCSSTEFHLIILFEG